MELCEKIIHAAIDEFQDKGLKFTMDDVAKRLRISKKTLYQVFESKEALMLSAADSYFADVKKSEKMILEDDSLDVVEKLRRIIVVLPDRYQNIGLVNLYGLQEKYPNVYRHAAKYLETDWGDTIALLEQGKAEGKLRDFPIPVLKAMVEGTIQHFLASTILVENQVSFEDGLSGMIDIIMDGIAVSDKRSQKGEHI